MQRMGLVFLLAFILASCNGTQEQGVPKQVAQVTQQLDQEDGETVNKQSNNHGQHGSQKNKEESCVVHCKSKCKQDVTIDSDDYIGGNPSAAEELENGVLKVNDVVYQANGFGNTAMVVTEKGNVVIDTAHKLYAASHKEMLQQIDDGDVKYIILTHGHTDHTGGVPLWKQEQTQVIAQSNYVEFVNYQGRLAGMLAHRNSRQFPALFNGYVVPYSAPDAEVHNYAGTNYATVLFDRFYEFKLGGLTFQMVNTPGETSDHLTVWIPEYKIAFMGDNFYGAFPNIYTLRGTKPRWALDYVESLDRVLSWNPEIVVLGHGAPLYGADIQEKIIPYRDAILYVHDETVRGMNAGKDVYTLMQEIELPESLAFPEGYGSVPWTVRGIYEGYIGWFDTNESTMYSTPPKSIFGEVVAMAGGADALAARASQMVTEGKLHEALHMTDMALEADPKNIAAKQARLLAMSTLLGQSVNGNEMGWLSSGIKILQSSLP